MPRKSAKNNPTNASEAMEMIMSIEPLRTVSEAAEFIGVEDSRLLEMFANALNQPEVLAWETIPQEHEHLLNEFKAQAQDIQALPESTEPVVASSVEQAIEQAQEPPQPQPKKRGRKPKAESSALTKRQKDAMEKKEQQAGNLAQSVTEVKRTIRRQKGAKSGAELAAIELAAEDMTYHAVKDQALRREIAIHGVEMGQHANFDPIQYLKESGLVGEGELLTDLQADVSDLLGKYEIATQEIVENSTLNHFNLDDAEALLNDLLNSEKSYW